MLKSITGFVRQLARPTVNNLRVRRRFDRACEAFAMNAIEAPVLYDIGARWGVSAPYDRLKKIPGFRSVGFEPDVEEAQRLEQAGQFDIVCAVGLGDRKETRTLYIAEDPGCSSLFPPDMAEAARHTVSKQFSTVGQVEVAVEPLDDVIQERGLPRPDFIKIDCEGAEGLIFEGAKNTLSNVVGITFEARLVDFYRGGATLGPLLETMFSAGFICLRLNPVGAFFDTQVMHDVVMIRHPDTYSTARETLLGQVFSLLHGSWLYAQRIADLTAASLSKNHA
jgi:FkbM family methyltransferase